MRAAFQVLSDGAARLGKMILRGVTRLHRSIQKQREERARMEFELYQGRFKVSSKNDDDLPITL